MEGLKSSRAVDMAKAVLAGEIDEGLADYHAMFEQGEEPLFLNIRAHEAGHGFGSIALYHFLTRVGIGNTFGVTDFKEDGKGRRMFDRAANDGLIEEVQPPSGFFGISQWRVIDDPLEILSRRIELTTSELSGMIGAK